MRKITQQLIHIWKRCWFWMYLSAYHESELFNSETDDKIERIVQRKYGGWKCQE